MNINVNIMYFDLILYDIVLKKEKNYLCMIIKKIFFIFYYNLGYLKLF